MTQKLHSALSLAAWNTAASQLMTVTDPIQQSSLLIQNETELTTDA